MKSSNSDFFDWLSGKKQQDSELLAIVDGDGLHLHCRARIESHDNNKIVLLLPPGDSRTMLPPNSITISPPDDCSFHFSEPGDTADPHFWFAPMVSWESGFYLKFRSGISVLLAALTEP